MISCPYIGRGFSFRTCVMAGHPADETGAYQACLLSYSQRCNPMDSPARGTTRSIAECVIQLPVICLFFLSLEKENILGNLGTLAQPQVIHNSNSIRKHYIQYVTNVLHLKKTQQTFCFNTFLYFHEELLLSQFLKQWYLT
jgi:hypothetical protein